MTGTEREWEEEFVRLADMRGEYRFSKLHEAYEQAVDQLGVGRALRIWDRAMGRSRTGRALAAQARS